MSELTDQARTASIATYLDAERRLERQAAIDHRSNRPYSAKRARRLAHQVGVERLRNQRGDGPDEWERPGSPEADA